MTKIGLLTFSDGCAFVARELDEFNRNAQDRLKLRLEMDGYRVVVGEDRG
jgi:pyruvate/2-oxoacid:ferredoxin oxidoreductase beta subunit